MDASKNLYYPKGNIIILDSILFLTALSIVIALPTIVKVIAVTLSYAKMQGQEE